MMTDGILEQCRISHQSIQGPDPSAITMRPGITISDLESQARPHFEHFCFGCIEAIMELGHFIREARDKKSFLDVGAAEGVFSLVFDAATDGRTFAIEPDPSVLARLNRLVQARPRIAVIPEALHSFDGVAPSRIEGIMRFSFPKPGDQMFPVRRGDSLLAELGFKPDLIKIDVEGREFDVLTGLVDTLRMLKPTVCLEIHRHYLQELGLDDSLRSFIGAMGDHEIIYTLTGEKISADELFDLSDVNPHVVLKPIA